MQYHNLAEEYYGKKIIKVDCDYTQGFDEEFIMTLEDGTTLCLCHDQDCCKHVVIEYIDIDPKDLVGSTLLSFEEAFKYSTDLYQCGSQWSASHKIQTNTTCATIRWVGESNGYCSESVNLQIIKGPVGFDPDWYIYDQEILPETILDMFLNE